LLPRIAKKNIDILNKQFWVPFIHGPEQKTRERRERVLNRGVDNKYKIKLSLYFISRHQKIPLKSTFL
jgi:hypothetical protein